MFGIFRVYIKMYAGTGGTVILSVGLLTGRIEALNTHPDLAPSLYYTSALSLSLHGMFYSDLDLDIKISIYMFHDF